MAKEHVTKSGREVTPDNPSRRAILRVKSPLPIPTRCRYCDAEVKCVPNSFIYGREIGEWPYAYRCTNDHCGAYVGLHPFTNIPLGILADQPLRNARCRAKDFFNAARPKNETRAQLYDRLADEMGLERGKAHFAWFDLEECERVIELCMEGKL